MIRHGQLSSRVMTGALMLRVARIICTMKSVARKRINSSSFGMMKVQGVEAGSGRNILQSRDSMSENSSHFLNEPVEICLSCTLV